MKKTYSKPFAEKIEFDYHTQVIASADCHKVWTDTSPISGTGCEGVQRQVSVNNQ